jgi:two-component system, LytTR family, response regulator
LNLRVAIVDDEELARRGILARLQRHSEVEVVAQCVNGRQAIDAIRRHTPDLVFLDVQMPGKTGFDVIENVGWEAFPYVIFVTAHDKYAIQAFEVNALDYLLKPIDDERFELAFQRAREALARDRECELGQRLASVLGEIGSGSPATRQTERIVVRSAGRVVFVKTSDIDWVEAAGDYVTLHAGKKSWLLRETIAEMERKLQAKGFARIHRSTLVNTERIGEMHALDNGEYRLVLRDGTELKLSRTHRHQLQGLFGLA